MSIIRGDSHCPQLPGIRDTLVALDGGNLLIFVVDVEHLEVLHAAVGDRPHAEGGVIRAGKEAVAIREGGQPPNFVGGVCIRRKMTLLQTGEFESGIISE